MDLSKTLICASLALLGSQAAMADTLKIGTEGGYPPWSMVDAAGKVTGFDADVGAALCKELNSDCKFIVQAFDSLIPSLDAKRFDLIIEGYRKARVKRPLLVVGGPTHALGHAGMEEVLPPEFDDSGVEVTLDVGEPAARQVVDSLTDQDPETGQITNTGEVGVIDGDRFQLRLDRRPAGLGHRHHVDGLCRCGEWHGEDRRYGAGADPGDGDAGDGGRGGEGLG
mgnify:CR=1 FL=1